MVADRAELAALAALPPELLVELDALVRARRWLEGMVLLRRREPRLGLDVAQVLVFTRAAQLGVTLASPEPTLAELRERADAIRPVPVAIEALWDGDTVHDWFVVLVAIVPAATERGLSEHSITPFYGAGAAARATEVGRDLASRLGVPFFFSSPEQVDDQAPRWWDSPR